MIGAGVEVSKNELLKRLGALYEKMKSDTERAGKLIQLMRKLSDSQYMIGFCGHFSAGKSSMINELMGENLLPASPIPTSANLVMVKQGREYARVYYKHGEVIEYPAPYDYDVIKEYCKDGDEIDSIEISHLTEKLPKGVTIMDTPGIDSTDDAHRVSTESALHLADLVFYVMDYNHVQSELNFQFTREMIERKKSLVLIINQVDKHKENELSFQDFQTSVEQSFLDWGVKPEAIFYTSLREKEHPYNQLSELKQLIASKIDTKDIALHASIFHSTEQLIHEHMTYYDHLNHEEKEILLSLIKGYTDEEIKNLPNEINSIKQAVDNITKETDEIKHVFLTNVNKVLDNAYLMPFSTRELAKDYIESAQSDFKVGLFFSKAKTEKEREKRLELFYEDVKEKVSTQLDWHLKEYLKNFLNDVNLTGYLSIVNQLPLPLSKELLVTCFKPGALLTGNYVLIYTDDVVKEIKKIARLQATSILDKVEVDIGSQTEHKASELKKKLEELQEAQKVQLKLEQLEKERTNYFLTLQHDLKDEHSAISQVDISSLIKDSTKIIISSTEDLLTKKVIDSGAEKSKLQKELKNQTLIRPENKVEQTIQELFVVKEKLSTVTGLSTIANDLVEKARRLDKNQFTIALFGAFSAGKSSFANALISENVLPVSPNPTTATINKIVPPTDQHKHGTVLVKVKSPTILLEDLQHSLQVFNEKVADLNDALSTINNKLMNMNELEGNEKPHYRFLQAVNSGFASLSNSLGELLIVGLDEFREFVANEEKACFVEWIELYYDCDITRKGITLVDTPGADSINARHTGVAFNYIKNADAILFVTYYNHAFSKADREFLIQLGRVKDTFSMDKMFFIINAADLAHSREELEHVCDYVEDQLISYGIRSPRLYAISSQMALNEKKQEASTKHKVLEASGIDLFEADFRHFIESELIDMTILSAYEDMKRARKMIDFYIESAKEDKEVRISKLHFVVSQEKQMLEIIKEYNYDQEVDGISQEIAELTYYIKQRIFLRYPDFFKEAFNPATLKDDGRDLKKALNSCLNELIQSIGFDLAQEMRATSLRVEKFINKTGKQVVTTLNRHLDKIDPHIEISTSFQFEFELIEFESGLKNLEHQPYKKALSTFKNPKSFFEKNEKKVMSDQLEKLLVEPVEAYLDENKLRIQKHYQEEFMVGFEKIKDKAIQEVLEYFEGIKQALSDEVDIEQLQTVRKILVEMEK